MKILYIYILLLVSMSMHAQVMKPWRIQNTSEQDAAETLQIPAVRGLKTIGSTATAPLPCMGSPKVPVILVQFQNKKFSIADTDERVVENYNLFFNAGEGVRPGQKGYESTCSVREYFRLQSGGQFTPEFSIIGPVTLSQDYEYYGRNSGSIMDVNISAFYSEACKLAVQNYNVDWSYFDNKGNGRVGFVFFIYAGPGENTTADFDTNTIWPKEGGSSKTVSYDGKSVTFGAYGCTSEMYQNGQDGIGVTVHELGHGLGLPDMYDTNYSAFGMDMWDVMDSGCYVLVGKSPINYTAYERDFMGWYSLETLNPDEAYTLTLDPLTDYGKAYKLPNKSNPNEYLILENRQSKGLDFYMGSVDVSIYEKYGTVHGLLVSHVDYNSSAWNGNYVNTNKSHQRMTIVPADGELISNVDGYNDKHAQSLRGDLYPGTKGTTELTSYAAFTGSEFTFTIDNIRETADGKIILDINGGDGTGINGVGDDSVGEGLYQEVYSVSGLRLQSLQKGLNIIRTPDGRVRKVYK